MLCVEEFNNVKTAAIHIEVYVPFLKTRRTGFPHFRFRVQLLYCFPCCLTDTFTVHSRNYKK